MVKAKSYSYDTNVVSERAFNEHIKLYEGYVSKINEIDSILKKDPQYLSANATYSHYRGLKKGETFALDAIILHEIYFNTMGKVEKKPDKETEKIIVEQFGSYENWLNDFIACGKAARGWCVLTYEQRTNTFRNILQDAHDYGDIIAGYPIIALDVYEHSYFIDYGTDKEKYIVNFTDSIDWNVVGKRISVLLNN